MSSLTDTVAPGVRSEGPRAFARFLGNYYLRRVIQSIALLFGVIIIVFIMRVFVYHVHHVHHNSYVC